MPADGGYGDRTECDPKAGSRWRDNGDGTYTATPHGHHSKHRSSCYGEAGQGHVAQFSVCHAGHGRARPAIATDATAYASGSDMVVTQTLKDGQDKPGDRGAAR